MVKSFVYTRDAAGAAVGGEGSTIVVKPNQVGVDSTGAVASELEDSSRKVINHPYLSWIDFAVLGAYVLGMLGVGYYIKLKVPSFEEFLVAGRSMTTPGKPTPGPTQIRIDPRRSGSIPEGPDQT